MRWKLVRMIGLQAALTAECRGLAPHLRTIGSLSSLSSELRANFLGNSRLDFRGYRVLGEDGRLGGGVQMPWANPPGRCSCEAALGTNATLHRSMRATTYLLTMGSSSESDEALFSVLDMVDRSSPGR
jgi:hypothetical protein